MQYDFNEPIDRSHNFAAKYDELQKKFGRTDVLPLWIADMDLKTAQPIMDAIDARNRQGMFGYTSRPDSYFEAVRDWQQRRHNWSPDPALMGFALGVVPALCTLVRTYTQPGDQVFFFTPVYGEFFNAVEDWDRKPLTCQLLEQPDGSYQVDWAAFEDCLKQHPPLMLFCHPHNPVGKVWTREELERISGLCLQYGVKMVSDEIHADLLLWGKEHIPLASLSPEVAANTITCVSATKTFNLAGLQASTTVYPTAEDRAKCEDSWRRNDVHRNNCFSLVAVEAAYRYGDEWLDQLLVHLQENMRYVQQFLAENIPQITVRLPDCTYLMWLDCRGMGMDDDALWDFFVNKARLGLNAGREFGPGGEGHMRLNVACPRCNLEEAMRRLKAAWDAR